MLAGFLLRVDQTVTEFDFVDAATRWNQRDLADFVNFFVKQLFRQTGGFLKVASRSAKLDRHRPPVVGHCVLLFLALPIVLRVGFRLFTNLLYMILGRNVKANRCSTAARARFPDGKRTRRTRIL